MDRMKFLRRATEIGVSLSAISLLLLAGCGGGGGSSSSTGTSTTTTTTVTGVGVCPSGAGAKVSVCGLAATGAAIGGIVYAYDVNGNASPIANINADGTYVIDATGLTAPLMVTTIGVSNLKPAIYHSIAKSSDLNKNVNVTPLTEVILAHAAGQPAQDIALASMPAVTNNIPAAASAVKAIIAPLTTAVGATVTDPMTDTFKADGTGMDKVLDNINVMPAKQGGTIDVRLVGNNVSLGTVALPATAGTAATATPNAGVTATQLSYAQKAAAAIAEANVCMTSLTSQYATAIPASSVVATYVDPNYKGFGFNQSTFATYMTTPASTGLGRGDIGLKWSIGAVADYDFTPPAAGATATTALPAPITFDVNGNITAMWATGNLGGFTFVSKLTKGAAYTGCPGGWLISGNGRTIGDMNIIPSYQKNTSTATPTYSRGVNVRMGLSALTTAYATASSVVVTGPGLATAGTAGTAPTPLTSITLVKPAAGNAMPVMLINGTNTITLPYCQDNPVAGTTCFDETKVAAGALYIWSIRDNANAVLQEMVVQFSKTDVTWAQVQANASRIFPTITSVSPATATWLASLNATANGAAAPAYTVNFTQGSFANGMPSGYVAVNDAIGTTLQIFQNPASATGVYTITGNKAAAYTNAAGAWVGIDSDFMGILVTSSGPK